MTASLIDPGQTRVLWSVILVGVAASIWLEQSYRWASRLSGPVIGLLIAMTLSSTGVMPTEAPAYEFVGDYMIPMAIPLLLFQANVVRIIRVTGRMFLAFHLSVLGTVAGTVAAVAVMSGMEKAAIVGGIMAASYSGGSVNFIAVKESFGDQIHDNLTNPLIVADNFIMAGMFMVLLVLATSRFMLRHFPPGPALEASSGDPRVTAEAHWSRKAIGLRDIAIALAVAFVISTVARSIADGFSGQTHGFAAAILGNLYVWITGFSLVVATLFHRQLDRINGAEELGGYALYVFLFTIGLPANLVVVLTSVPEMFAFCAIIAVVNLAVTLGLGKLCRLDLPDLLVSVNATLGGPPSAVAMAVSLGWSKLVLPAMLVGIWGYVIGTALGVAVAEMLLRLVP